MKTFSPQIRYQRPKSVPKSTNIALWGPSESRTCQRRAPGLPKHGKNHPLWRLCWDPGRHVSCHVFMCFLNASFSPLWPIFESQRYPKASQKGGEMEPKTTPGPLCGRRQNHAIYRTGDIWQGPGSAPRPNFSPMAFPDPPRRGLGEHF